MPDTLREKVKDKLRNYRYGSGATLDGSSDAILALFQQELSDASDLVRTFERRAEKAEAREAALREAAEGCVPREGESIDFPTILERIDALRAAVDDPMDGTRETDAGATLATVKEGYR